MGQEGQEEPGEPGEPCNSPWPLALASPILGNATNEKVLDLDGLSPPVVWLVG